MAEKTINTVYEYRMKLGVTQEVLAKAVGVTRQTIIAIEKGNYTPSVALAINICVFFKTRVEDVFKVQ